MKEPAVESGNGGETAGSVSWPSQMVRADVFQAQVVEDNRTSP
jgi:hypothetical protein